MPINNYSLNSIKKTYIPLLFSLLFILGIIFGSFIGSPVSLKQKNEIIKGAKGDKIYDIINYINQAYVDSTNSKELEDKAIKGLLQSLDPHSEYIPSSEYNDINEQLEGKFEGIGVQFRLEKDTIFVINTISGGPSGKVGIRAGDRIILINNKIFTGRRITNEIVIRNLKGKAGTKVKVSILRRGIKSLIDFTITRDEIPTYSVDASFIIKNHIGYIKISKFSATTIEEFSKALSTLEKQGLQKLILDLRGNGGGYLESAIKVADELLQKGKMIVYTKGNHSPKREIFATGEGVFEKNPLVVLIDDWSASASEIVTGAIQDNDRGTIIGRRSFGKGLVQEQMKLKDGSAIRLTIARYYTPTGRCIQKPYDNGVEDYYDKFYERFINGELQNPDSIHFKNKLKYKTPAGKIVYGGGGIMPDIYIVVKKDEFPQFYSKSLNKGLIFQYAFDYADKNRNELKNYKNINNFTAKFNVSSSLLTEFYSYAIKKGISKDIDYKESEKYLKLQLKADIARNLFNEEAYIKLINPIDKTISKAIEVLEKEK